jgi:phosphoribosylformylglycinamidine synthase PurS subunit
VKFDARVEVLPKEGIADPEGATIERALPALGFTGVGSVRAGRSFRLTLDADDAAHARVLAQSVADRLLANPVLELATVELTEP